MRSEDEQKRLSNELGSGAGRGGRGAQKGVFRVLFSLPYFTQVRFGQKINEQCLLLGSGNLNTGQF